MRGPGAGDFLTGAAIGLVCLLLIGGIAFRSADIGAPAEWVRSLGPEIVAAIAIGFFEEAFFRGFVLDGLAQEWGTAAGLIGSSAIYALAHVVRSPKHYYISGFVPLAGWQVLRMDVARLGLAREWMPDAVGLFLLGLVLGAAFIRTKRIYMPAGLHAVFVLGAKSWRTLVAGAVPWWIVGRGRTPIIGAPMAWAIAVVLLVVFLSRRRERV